MGESEFSTQKYFDKVPKGWDSLYSKDNWFMYIFNRLFRKGLFDRYELTFKYCGEIKGKGVLDVGCGTGRFSLEFAKRGAAHVVGIDFSQSMIDFSRDIAQKHGMAETCEFICDDFSMHEFNQKFDIIVAMGFFDYIDNPGQLLKTIYGLSNGVFLASFPRPSFIRDIQRKVRYKLIKKVNIYSYTKKDLELLYAQAGFSGIKIVKIGAGLFVIAKKS